MMDAIIFAGLEELENYIAIRKNTVSHYISTWTIMDLWVEEEKHLGTWVEKRWW